MSDALLDYSSWSFQLILLLAVLYLVFGLAKPTWVLATKRSTVVIVAVVVMLVASTLFYMAIRPLPDALEPPAEIGTEPPVPQSAPTQP
jgi:uncharacterized ion transporter superfamily protein YfcC